jgi:hypothetical protein
MRVLREDGHCIFKMSRSRRSRSFSRFKRRSSSSSGVKCPLPGKASSPWWANWRFQRERPPWPIPSRFSTAPAVTPGSDAIRTASSLNSLSYDFGIHTPPLPQKYNWLLGVLIECKTSSKSPLIKKEEARAVLQKAADFDKKLKKVSLGNPAFDETSKYKCAVPKDITLVEHSVL